MLSVEEALLFQAVRDEQERQEAMGQAGTAGAIGGAALGTLGGAVPHQIGRAVNALRGREPNRLRPGFRAAGGLVGTILGGGLGAGAAAMMKQESEAGELLGKIQAQKGQLSEMDEARLGQLLGEMYQNPSQMM